MLTLLIIEDSHLLCKLILCKLDIQLLMWIWSLQVVVVVADTV